ncbi:phage protein [Streptococcus porcinus]|uniref:Gp15 family bacteriophage protein n=1 Tax=Streptococcus porcinus TaxID=1340 RepID=UPI0010CABB30|nr:Gp15 family bacteriophage protein [Streptococcus porcinus]VTS32618.1 phage protein [Streptococcus porcinus]
MLDLSRKLTDELVLADKVYPMNISFNKVFKVIELINDDVVDEVYKPFLAIQIFTDVDFTQILSIEDATLVFKLIFDEHIKLIPAKDTAPVLDLAGNPIKSKIRSKSSSSDEKPIFSFKYDAEYIYASFMQAYKIDLIDVQNSLHWKKFNALLNGLPSNTKFAEVLKIRSYKPQEGDSRKYKEQMRKLKKEYALPQNFDY